jgi:hypothetical protein
MPDRMMVEVPRIDGDIRLAHGFDPCFAAVCRPQPRLAPNSAVFVATPLRESGQRA